MFLPLCLVVPFQFYPLTKLVPTSSKSTRPKSAEPPWKQILVRYLVRARIGQRLGLCRSVGRGYPVSVQLQRGVWAKSEVIFYMF